MKNIILILFFFSGYFSIAQFGGPKGCATQSKSQSKKNDYINWSYYNTFNSKLPIKTFWKKAIVPVALGSTALSINYLPLKQNIQNSIRVPFNGFKTHLDNYIQYAPIAIMYSADMFKLKAKHSVWNQTKLLFLSELSTGIIVFSLKYTIGIQRPDSSSYTSFPSGHTAQAFVTAQVLHNEFNRTQPLIANSGYLFSTATGLLRIVNNKHWLPDVLMGAGIAILTTNLIYHFEPFMNWTPKFIQKMDKNGSQKSYSFQLHPVFYDDYAGLNLKLNL